MNDTTRNIFAFNHNINGTSINILRVELEIKTRINGTR